MYQGSIRRQPARLAPEAWATRIAPTVSIASPVDALLSAESFDGAAADRLARRDKYADAADRLQSIAGVGGGLIASLIDSHSPFAAFRFATLFGVIPWDAHREQPYTTADLRAASSHEAALALIALGHESEWSKMCRRGRAIFFLRYIVAAMRRTT